MSRRYDMDDWQQEYALALLEGDSDEKAEKRARKASYKGVRNGGGVALSLDWPYEGGTWADLLVDNTPTPADLADRWHDQDVNADEARRLLEHCTPVQRAALEIRWGLKTGFKETLKDTAEMLGYAQHSGAQAAVDAGVARIVRKEAEGPVSEERLRRREIQRRSQAKRRARLRAEAAT